MKNISKFQLIVLGVFAAFFIIGILVFAMARSGSRTAVIEVLMWGAMPRNQFAEVLKATGLDQNEEIKISYEEKRPETFDQELLEALAKDAGPDLFFVSSDNLLKQKQRIFAVPLASFSERDFKNSFIEGAEVFLSEEGVWALPISIDPMVMYWNRDIFTFAGLIEPPSFWDEFYDISSALTRRDPNFNITRSALALGEFTNINHAFEILSLLIMQAGNPIAEKKSNGVLTSTLDEARDLPALPAERALSFYTEFSNPLKPFYSWNRALPKSKDFFVAGDLAIYLGFASELFEIRDRNPNLNFDVALIPQAESVNNRIVYGKMEGLAISNRSRNIAGAFRVASILSGQDNSRAFSQVRNLPPARRDLLSLRPERAFMETFYQSAVISKTWPVPDKTRVSNIFRNMIESVTGGRAVVRDAVQRAHQELNLILR